MEEDQTTYKLTSNKSDPRRGLELLKKLFKPYIKDFIFLLLILIIGSVTSVLIPYFLKIAIDENIADKDLNGLGTTVLIIGGLSLASLFFTYLQIRYTGVLGQKALFELRSKIFNKLQELPIQFFAENKSGDIIQRITNDVERVNQFLSEGVVRLAGLIFGMTFIFIAMFLVEQRLSLIPLTTLLISGIFLFFHGEIVRRLNKENLDKEGLLSSIALEILNGFKVVKAYGAEKHSMNNFEGFSMDSKNIAIKTFAISNVTAPFMDTLTRLGTIAALVAGLLLMNNNLLTIGGVIAYLAYLEQFFRPLSGLASLWSNIQGGIAASQRIDELLHLKSNIQSPERAYSPKTSEIKGDVVFDKVGFKYQGQEHFVLENISFEAKQGETIAIVGQTGAGKTTLVNLVARLYDITEGEVVIDNVNIKNWDLDKLRDQVGYILQDPFFFEDTILNNLTYPDNQATKEEIEETIEKLGIAGFINRLPKGLDTVLQKNAENISAGQRQILALARVILKKPKILILDEATARIDTISEKVLDRALEKYTDKITTFIIAHRLNTIKNADKIIFIYDNTVLEYGRREDLLNKKGKFYKLYEKFKSDLEVK